MIWASNHDAVNQSDKLETVNWIEMNEKIRGIKAFA